MNVLPPISDNISEVLVKIIRFTELRQRALHRNLRHADLPWFVPQDLPVREFAEALDEAVAEHLRSRRLLFRDQANIEFGPNNAMRIRPVADPHAHALLRTSRDEYVELQVNKLLENTLNRRVAEELLRQKCGTCPAAIHGDVNETVAGDDPARSLPARREMAD
jgi:hypothetical protein